MTMMDEPIEAYEPTRDLEFRDGICEIPAYLADMMVGLATHTMTKDEAIKAANDNHLKRVVDSSFDAVLKQHFGGPR